ncbi:MAG: protein translocase subunit SecD [Chloroflexi bacterium]|jgi:preprotein translocase subunit SecD|nr:protein translocase subunit SecD [Chloroflexota bacterium]
MKQRRYYRLFVIILVLLAGAVWVVVTENSTILGREIFTHLGLDLVGGVQALLEADVPADATIDPNSMDTARTIIENRVNGLLGVGEATVQKAGERRIVVELPGEQNPEQALSTLKETGLLEFVDMGMDPVPAGTIIQTDFVLGNADASQPGDADASFGEIQQIWHTIMTGADLKEVGVTISQFKEYQVAFELTSEGGKLFADYTTNNVGGYLAIVLDKTVISTPRVNTPITGGSGLISGDFDQEEANKLSVQLRYGSLPVPLKVIETRAIGPTLGQDSLQKSLKAGAIGMGIVILFMALYYRLPGVVADFALITYALLTFALFKLIPVTLTLPGIAGFVLSIGMAVDANVLIFERLKEELKQGKSLHYAIDLAWNRAWPSIRDSNISTLITCAILFWFGSTFGASLIKGFAVTLALGVGVSLFTAVTVTRTYLHIVMDNIKLSDRHEWFGL